MLKSYEEMRKIDVSAFVEQRDGMDYLNWAKCVELLHDNGANVVYFEPVVNEKTGSSLFCSEREFEDKNGVKNCCYEVAVDVYVDDNKWRFRGPLTNGSNPVKDNSMTQQRIWNCQCRLFVKCIAIHTGLGFNLWLKEEKANSKAEDFANPFNHSLGVIKERIEELVTTKLKSGLSLAEIATKCNLRDEDEVRNLLKQLAYVDQFEKKLRSL